MFKKISFIIILFIFFQVTVFSQTHAAVPLGNPVYIALEQAQMRGLCNSLPGVKPYSKAQILSIIDEIFDNEQNRRFGRLTDSERVILEQFKLAFSPDRGGLDLTRGTVSAEHTVNDIYFSAEFGFGLDFTFASGYFQTAGGYQYSNDDDPLFYGASHPAAGDFYTDIATGPSLSFIGDLGRNMSYGLTINGLVLKSPRAVLGVHDSCVVNEFNNRSLTIRSEPLAYFPYTYKKRWDGFVWAVEKIDNAGQLAWPNDLSIGYAMFPEFAVSGLNGHLFFRFARLDREWAGMTTNGSLVLNQSAQPFLAFETVITPFKWVSISSLTGVLEYSNEIRETNSAEMKEVSQSFQNAFSIVMLEFNIKNIFHIDLGSSVVWPKRFELGYIFPFAENFLYQNNIGDFDNMALFINVLAQYPGIGKIWASLLLDEANPEPDFFSLDRMTYAYQFGGAFQIPWLSFTTLTFSYTKNEPYNYTHMRGVKPWYGETLMETNYVNFGRSLGHYIPPNSDEILIRVDSLPAPQLLVSLQYQLIRHGAAYGDRAVDGSTLWSELPQYNRSKIPALRKYFLKDGAYQWMHTVRLRGEYSFTGLRAPVRIFCELGGVYSYFTDIEGEVNSGTSGVYSIIDTPQYPHSLRFIGIIGLQIFPKF